MMEDRDRGPAKPGCKGDAGMSESVQRARRPWAISEMVSWVVIVLAVGLVMVSVMLRQRA